MVQYFIVLFSVACFWSDGVAYVFSQGKTGDDPANCNFFGPDGSKFNPMLTTAEYLTPKVDVLEMAVEYWKDVGLNIDFEIISISLKISQQVVDTEMHQDETKFRQIFGNLIQNAFHHRREKVEITMNCADDQIFVEISDDGPGIDPDHHEAVFQRYTQVKECTVSPRNGHGLGLAGARILARCLGGDIQLESEKGKGATFRLMLPLTFSEDTPQI